MLQAARIILALTCAAGAVEAQAISVALGASSETFTLYGQGPVAPGIGGFRIGQGASSFDGVTSTFTLSGAITGGDPGYNSGTYSFVTKYAGPDTPAAGPAAPGAQSNPGNTNQFFYTFLAPSTSIVLFLNTPGLNYAIPLVTGGNFVNGFFFQFVTATCTGVATCDQNTVGLTPGATIAGPVTIGASFAAAPVVPGVPEPAAWALLVAGFGTVGTAVRRRRAGIVVTA